MEGDGNGTANGFRKMGRGILEDVSWSRRNMRIISKIRAKIRKQVTRAPSKTGKTHKVNGKTKTGKLHNFGKKLVEDSRLVDAVWMMIIYWGTHSFLVATHSPVIS